MITDPPLFTCPCPSTLDPRHFRLPAHLLPHEPGGHLPEFHLQVFGLDTPEQVEEARDQPVHPVWWLAPSPAPLSPWKYS